jgi:hypothetical protein
VALKLYVVLRHTSVAEPAVAELDAELVAAEERLHSARLQHSDNVVAGPAAHSVAGQALVDLACAVEDHGDVGEGLVHCAGCISLDWAYMHIHLMGGEDAVVGQGWSWLCEARFWTMVESQVAVVEYVVFVVDDVGRRH